MGLTFKTYKNNLSLSEILTEMFDSVPFKTTFEFNKGNTYEIETKPFNDYHGNEIIVGFFRNDSGFYEIDFSVNGDSFQADTSYSLKDYSRLLATVAKAVSQFLAEFSPLGVQASANNILSKVKNNPKTKNQKGRIYQYFISQLDDKGRYSVDKKDPMNIKITLK